MQFFIFQVCDTSDDTYYPLGTFLQLDLAINAMDNYFMLNEEPPSSPYDKDDFVELTIKKFKSGWGEAQDVWTRTYVHELVEHPDGEEEFRWRIK